MHLVAARAGIYLNPVSAGWRLEYSVQSTHMIKRPQARPPTMSNPSLEPEVLISRVYHDTCDLRRAMITIAGCLCCNPSLRMLLPKDAKRYFGLSERHLQQLPTLYVIAGNPSPEHCRLVSAKAARALGLVVHGSVEKLAQATYEEEMQVNRTPHERIPHARASGTPRSGLAVTAKPGQYTDSSRLWHGFHSVPFTLKVGQDRALTPGCVEGQILGR